MLRIPKLRTGQSYIVLFCWRFSRPSTSFDRERVMVGTHLLQFYATPVQLLMRTIKLLKTNITSTIIPRTGINIFILCNIFVLLRESNTPRHQGHRRVWDIKWAAYSNLRVDDEVDGMVRVQHARAVHEHAPPAHLPRVQHYLQHN